MKIVPDRTPNIIEKFSALDNSNLNNRSLKSSKTFAGLQTKRSCTDVFCVILFFVFNFGLAVVIYLIFSLSNINRIVHGSDFRGNVCGSGTLIEKKYNYYPDPTDLTISLCLKSCPNSVKPTSICYYDIDGVTLLPVWGCWDSIPSTVYAYFCFPYSQDLRMDVVNNFFTSANLIRRGFGDFLNTADIVALGVLSSLIYSGIFISVFNAPCNFYLARVKKLTVVSIFLNFFYFVACAALVYYNSMLIHSNLCGVNNEVSPGICYRTPELGLQILSYFIVFVLIIYIIYACAYKKNLENVEETFELISEPIQRIRNMKFIPIAQVIIGIILISGSFLIILYTFGIASISTIENNNVPGGYVNVLSYSVTDQLMLIFVLVMFFWWGSFALAICEFIMGGIIGAWYFTKEKSTLYHPISYSVKNCFKFHLGSILRGAFFNFLFFLPNFFLRTIDNFCKKHTDSKFSQCLTLILWPFLYVYHKFMKFNTKYTYIYLSIFASPYSISASQCFFLLSRNSSEIDLNLKAISYCVFHIKLSLILLGFLTTYSFLTFSSTTFLNFSTSNLQSTLSPSVFTMIFCMYFSEIVVETLVSNINAIIICQIADEEMFMGDQRYMGKKIDKKGKKLIESEEEHKQGIKNSLEISKRNENMETGRMNFKSNPIEVQKPGRSNRIETNLAEFDENFNVIQMDPEKSFVKSEVKPSPIYGNFLENSFKSRGNDPNLSSLNSSRIISPQVQNLANTSSILNKSLNTSKKSLHHFNLYSGP